jgi:hypothetical protein
MACLQGDQQALESGTNIGISLEISDASCYAGMFKAKISFDIRHYSDYIPRGTFDPLLDAGLKIDARRQNEHFF